MKKFLAIILTTAMVCSLAACGSKKDPGAPDTGNAGTGTENASGADKEENSAGGEQDGGSGEGTEAADAVNLLAAIWDTYGEDEKFAVAGGDFSEENSVMDAPGKYGIGDTAALDATLGLPASCAGMVDDAASLMHMMNANTFTCGAFHVSKSDDLAEVAESLRANILQREWMCGFPDKLIIITVGDYVISAFGNEEIIDAFKTKTLSVYASANLVYEESLL